MGEIGQKKEQGQYDPVFPGFYIFVVFPIANEEKKQGQCENKVIKSFMIQTVVGQGKNNQNSIPGDSSGKGFGRIEKSQGERYKIHGHQKLYGHKRADNKIQGREKEAIDEIGYQRWLESKVLTEKSITQDKFFEQVGII